MSQKPKRQDPPTSLRIPDELKELLRDVAQALGEKEHRIAIQALRVGLAHIKGQRIAA